MPSPPRAIELNLEEITHYAKLDVEALHQLVHAACTQGYASIDSLFIPGMLPGMDKRAATVKKGDRPISRHSHCFYERKHKHQWS